MGAGSVGVPYLKWEVQYLGAEILDSPLEILYCSCGWRFVVDL